MSSEIQDGAYMSSFRFELCFEYFAKYGFGPE